MQPSTTTRAIQSKAFGEITIQEQQIIRFEQGLFGFESLHDYALLDSATPPFFWLQNLHRADLAFVLVNPYLVTPDFVLDVSEDDVSAIGDPEPADLVVFTIVTIPNDGTSITCNMQGPIIMNRRSKVALQAISLSQNWQIKHPLGQRNGG